MGIIKNILFGKYLIITNTVSCGLMMGLGDVIQQKSESWKRKYLSIEELNDEAEVLSPQSSNNANNQTQKSIILPNTATSVDSLDLMRVRNMLAVGIAQGPFHHYFYAFLDKILPGRNATSIMKKTLLDQTIASPTCLGIFFFGHGALESKQANDMLDEIRGKFLTIYKVDCCFWPPTQIINFLLVPVRYRVIYVNVMNIIYDIFLSYAKYESD